MSISAYVHIPFCSHKCEFCDFAAFEGLLHLEDAYSDVVAQEIETRLAQTPVADQLNSIFYGGGTPGLIKTENLENIHRALTTRVSVCDTAEISLETTPHAITFDKAKDWLALGINRISIGVESFNDQELKSIGRDHSRHEAERGIELALSAGFKNVSLDFMYGLPTQTLESWTATLMCMANWAHNHEEISHFSAYGLHLAASSPLFSRFPKDSTDYPDELLFEQMYDRLVETAIASGFEQYEVSNFAKPGFYSRHNMSYWNNSDYLAFGVSAHRYVGGVRSSNWRSLRRYMKDPLHDETKEEIDTATRIKEAIMLGLRLRRGIDVAEFARQYGVDLRQKYRGELTTLFEGGLVELTDNHLRITHKGVPVSNSIICRFF